MDFIFTKNTRAGVSGHKNRKRRSNLSFLMEEFAVNSWSPDDSENQKGLILSEVIQRQTSYDVTHVESNILNYI